MLREVALILLLLLSVASAGSSISRWLLLVHHVQLVGPGARLHDHAARLVVLYLGKELAVVLHIHHHHVVI